jgi:hypothetical protein
VIGGSSTNTAS